MRLVKAVPPTHTDTSNWRMVMSADERTHRKLDLAFAFFVDKRKGKTSEEEIDCVGDEVQLAKDLTNGDAGNVELLGHFNALRLISELRWRARLPDEVAAIVHTALAEHTMNCPLRSEFESLMGKAVDKASSEAAAKAVEQAMLRFLTHSSREGAKKGGWWNTSTLSWRGLKISGAAAIIVSFAIALVVLFAWNWWQSHSTRNDVEQLKSAVYRSIGEKEGPYVPHP